MFQKTRDSRDSKREKKKNNNFCACEGKAENVNSQCELAESWAWVLCALGCCSVRGRALLAQSWLHPCPFPWNSQPGMCPGDKCLCCRDTEALSKWGLGPSSPCWGHWGSSGLAGTGAGSHSPGAEGTQGRCSQAPASSRDMAQAPLVSDECIETEGLRWT